jgi:hypothetical protein
MHDFIKEEKKGLLVCSGSGLAQRLKADGFGKVWVDNGMIT